MLNYRADIDGLRAIAVLAVIIFHVEPDWLRGGFAGVDIFFVISGFLITSILKNDLYNNQFSLAQFYERRARRILPALVTVCAVTLAAFHFTFFPADYIELAKSTIATALSISNIFFWKVIDYFATASEEKPLLHTWSLGVEEQFYLFFPLILYALDKYFPEKRVAFIIAALGLLSLGFAEYAVRHYPNFAFYWLPSRFWELALGAGLAYLPRMDLHQRMNNVLAVSGFIMIGLAYALYSDDVKFPGIAALLPCLGAAFLIYAAPSNIISTKILSRPAMVAIGKMSYSLYLWHWPVLAFTRYRFEDPGILAYIITVVVTFILSYASLRFIETPFRNRNFLTKRSILFLSLASLLILIAASTLILQHKGLPQRFPARAMEIADTAINDKPPFLHEVCLNASNPSCFFGKIENKNINLVLWGDSHASSLIPLFDKFTKEKNIKGIPLTKSACPGLIGDYKWDDAEFAACKKYNDEVFKYLIADKEIRYVVLSARWTPVAKKIIFENNQDDAFYRALAHTAQILRQNGKTVFLIAPVPEIEFNPPRCLSRQEAFGSHFFTCAPPTLSEYMDRQKQALSVFSALAEDNMVFYPHQSLCPSTNCQIEMKGRLLYFDDDHLSRTGALYLYPAFIADFERNKKTTNGHK